MAQYGRTWWGERFLQALERFTDPRRLGRGRAYAGNGRVTEHVLKDGVVRAKVRGSINPYFGVYKEPLYDTTIKIKQIPRAGWEQVIRRIASRADLIAKLLQQEMPDRIEEVFAAEDVHLLPGSRSDFTTQCSCPDWENPCKHIAGVYFLLARDLDRDPFVLFELRGLSREALHEELVKSPMGEILASELKSEDVPVQPVASYHTRPTRSKVNAQPGNGKAGAAKDGNAAADHPELNHREFWAGARRLPPLAPAPPTRVPALVVKRQGDYPPFWHKDSSFVETMEELYERVRAKSPQMK
ncbi:MAG: SWIM zinc finger family protein [Chloroflexota bacterium]